MIEFVSGDILRADVEAIVNPVNCVGVMGSGLALAIRKAYPEVYLSYTQACQNKEVEPGSLILHSTKRAINPRYVVSFPTKRHWKDKSLLDDIDAGLDALEAVLGVYGVRSVAIPALGCGLGGLNWSDVRDLISSHLKGYAGTRILVYEPWSGKTPGKAAHQL